jgi:hypothetical protein
LSTSDGKYIDCFILLPTDFLFGWNCFDTFAKLMPWIGVAQKAGLDWTTARNISPSIGNGTEFECDGIPEGYSCEERWESKVAGSGSCLFAGLSPEIYKFYTFCLLPYFT